jgi:ATP-binding cassette, subfamily B, bacterial PglK
MGFLAELWNVFTPRQRRWVVWAQLLSMLMAASTMAGIASIAPFFALLGNPQSVEHPGFVQWFYVHLDVSDVRRFEMILGIGFAALVLAANLINVVGSFIMIRVALRIGSDLQSALFAEYLARPYAFHAASHSAALSSNVMFETNRVTNEILQNMFLLITNCATAACIVLLMALLNPTVAVAMMTALAGCYALLYLVVRNRLLIAGQIQTHFHAEQNRIVNESLNAIKEILILRLQAFFDERFVRSTRSFARAAARTQIIGQSPRYVIESIAVVGLVAAALLMGDGTIDHWLGQVTLLGFAAYRLLPTLQQVFVSVVKIRAATASFRQIAPDLHLARNRPIPAARMTWKQAPAREIRLQEISFAYDASRPPALDRISLRIPARAAIGLVGVNGSGKSTAADLIAGLLVPDGGRLEVDGIAIDDTNRAAWQSCIAYVPQQVVLLDASIAENIALGVANAAIDRQRLIEAAKLAQLDKFILGLRDGYDHRIGERGVRLSGGQRQRVGIARALYRTASVLILDEFTNSLDGLTERELTATIMTLRGRCTIILIAHRLSAIRACDLVFELNEGKIIGQGSCAELRKTSAAFGRPIDVS